MIGSWADAMAAAMNETAPDYVPPRPQPGEFGDAIITLSNFLMTRFQPGELPPSVAIALGVIAAEGSHVTREAGL